MGEPWPQAPRDASGDEDEDENGEEDGYVPTAYHDPLKGGSRSTNLVVENSGYVQDWEARHGFRELYQNWQDAIKESFGLGSRKFIIKPQHDINFRLFIAIHPDNGTETGFIKFWKKKGVVELTNYNAWLSGKTLGTGSTSKIGKDHLAGHHGEGYKLAALVLLREEYCMRIKASGCGWRFFEAPLGTGDEGELRALITPRRPSELQRLKDTYAKRVSQGRKRLRKGNIWEDVTFEIGGGEGLQVPEAEFLQWIKLALELDPPSKALETRRGSLILDPKFSNNMFLKGILLEESSSASTRFKFGYNLSQGRVDRDRKRLSSIEEQGQLLAEIWAEAMEKDMTLVAEYVNMLQSHPPPADVARAEQYITKQTARRIWQHLLDRDPERKVFYYDSRQGEKDFELIANSLKKDPVQLLPPAWIPLEKFNYSRSPQKQQIRLFLNAPEAADNGTIYSTGLKRALDAAFALDARTNGLKVVFKDVNKAQLTLLLSESKLQINEVWLDFGASHEKCPCWLSRRAQVEGPIVDQLSCDHIVVELYKLALEEVKRHSGPGPGQSSDSDSYLCQRVCESLRQMPMMVTAGPGSQPGEIEVSWTDLEGDLISRMCRLDPKCRVILHRESTCSLRRGDILISTSPKGNESLSGTIHAAQKGPAIVSKCDCPVQVVSRKTFKATFTGLSHEEEYFPMISRNEPQAFFGLAPAPVRPTSFVSASASLKSSPTKDEPAYQQFTQYSLDGDYEDIYDVSSNSGSEFMDTDSPRPIPSIRTPVDESERKPGERGDDVQSRPASPTNSPQVQVATQAQIQENNQLQQAEGTVEDIYEELDNACAILESLKDKLSRFRAENENLKTQLKDVTRSRHNADTQVQTAQAQVDAKKEQLATKEEELQAARAEIQQQQESLVRMGRDAKVQIKILQTQIQGLKKENEELDEDLQLAEDAWDRLTNDWHERKSRRRKRTRRSDVLPSPKRSKTGITTGGSATESTREHGDSISGSRVPPIV